MNNRILIPVLIFPLVVALIVGLFFVFRADDIHVYQRQGLRL